jgi:transcription termination/antitermination protein NusA
VATSLLYQTIDQLSREKGIDPQIIISAVEDAMLVATRKYYKTAENLESRFNKESGSVEVFAVKKVVEQVTDPVNELTLEQARALDPEAALEGEVRIPKPTGVLGRIAAQTAKQVIFQKVRDAERETVYAEYNHRVGELVNCTVKRLEGPDVIVDLGRTEGRMPRREQSRLETYQVGDRLRAVISMVDRAARGPLVVVSRADAMLVQRLFEMEVPEVYDGTVVIRAMAREAGERTKVAVYSKDPDVDCVGACVGMKGMRVQSIIRELKGEKIDIIEHNEDALAFAANALSPAKINHVSIVEADEKRLEVIVDDTQLSLAIGKKGQNVRLAAKLLGWHIDIKSEEEKRQEIETQMAEMARRGAAISELKGLGDKTVQKLTEHGVETVEQLARMTPDELTEIPGIGEKTVERIRKVVTDYFEASEAAKEEEEPAAGAGGEPSTAAPEAGAEATKEGEEAAASADGEPPTIPSEPAGEAITAPAASEEQPGVTGQEPVGESEAVSVSPGSEEISASPSEAGVEAKGQEPVALTEEPSVEAQAEEPNPSAGDAKNTLD